MVNLSTIGVLIALIVTSAIKHVDSVDYPEFELDTKVAPVEKCSTNGVICFGVNVNLQRPVATDNTHGCLEGFTKASHNCTYLLIGQLHKTFADKIDWSLTIREDYGWKHHFIKVGPKDIGSAANDWSDLVYMFTKWTKVSKPDYGVGVALRGQKDKIIRPDRDDNDFTKIGFRGGLGPTGPTTYFISNNFVNYISNGKELIRTKMADVPFVLVMKIMAPKNIIQNPGGDDYVYFQRDKIVSAAVSFKKEPRVIVVRPPTTRRPVVIRPPPTRPPTGWPLITFPPITWPTGTWPPITFEPVVPPVVPPVVVVDPGVDDPVIDDPVIDDPVIETDPEVGDNGTDGNNGADDGSGGDNAPGDDKSPATVLESGLLITLIVSVSSFLQV